MRVKIEILPEATQPYAVLYTSELTKEVRQAAALLEGETSGGFVTVTENERIHVLRPEDVYMVRVENEKTCVYVKDKTYVSTKRLYEFEEALGNGFLRISKSALVNLSHLSCVEPNLGGLMELVLKNGLREYISRKYLPAFKAYLGL